MNQHLVAFLLVLFVYAGTQNSFADGPTVDFRFPIVADEQSGNDAVVLAKELAPSIGYPKERFMRLSANPGCAFWIEKDPFAALGSKGYFIRIEEGGAVLHYSDLVAGRAGVERLRKLLSVGNSRGQLPIGILTNIRILGGNAEEEEQDREEKGRKARGENGREAVDRKLPEASQ